MLQRQQHEKWNNDSSETVQQDAGERVTDK